jgi:hypothetical protein
MSDSDPDEEGSALTRQRFPVQSSRIQRYGFFSRKEKKKRPKIKIFFLLFLSSWSKPSPQALLLEECEFQSLLRFFV